MPKSNESDLLDELIRRSNQLLSSCTNQTRIERLLQKQSEVQRHVRQAKDELDEDIAKATLKYISGRLIRERARLTYSENGFNIIKTSGLRWERLYVAFGSKVIYDSQPTKASTKHKVADYHQVASAIDELRRLMVLDDLSLAV